MVCRKSKSSSEAQKSARKTGPDKERLQKVMAAAGLGSRRACEQMIVEGLVSVNGQTLRKLPVLVDPTRDRILVQGRRLARVRGASRGQTLRPEKFVYYLLNKPKGVISR